MNKKVSIFSVGRSESKALQLYVSVGLANKFEKVWVSYEPFKYGEKSLGVTSYGSYMDQHLPKLVNCLNEREKEHLDNFVRGIDSDYATVSKFIRAGGRSRHIIDRINVDVVFLLVRDIYGVVKSIIRRTWNLAEDWDRLCSEARGQYPLIESYLQAGTDKLLQSSIYWYIMNARMIEDLGKSDCNVRLIRFKDIVNLEEVCRSAGLPTPPNDIGGHLLRGKRIHSESPLTTVTPEKHTGACLRQKIPATIWRQVPSLAPRQNGSLCALNYDAEDQSLDHQEKRTPNLEVTVERHSLLDTLRSKISSRLAKFFGFGLDDPVVIQSRKKEV
ncbi:hypothetical protein [Salinibacter ruber]|uniref:hypothetical protein n=1 Tax=Salinibacter ruber TaxID=146919 RepID=UPI002072B1F3|nr:hypothetical protein [Salinibacter ruber]